MKLAGHMVLTVCLFALELERRRCLRCFPGSGRQPTVTRARDLRPVPPPSLLLLLLLLFLLLSFLSSFASASISCKLGQVQEQQQQATHCHPLPRTRLAPPPHLFPIFADCLQEKLKPNNCQTGPYCSFSSSFFYLQPLRPKFWSVGVL